VTLAFDRCVTVQHVEYSTAQARLLDTLEAEVVKGRVVGEQVVKVGREV
jgi:hypothetical protein